MIIEINQKGRFTYINQITGEKWPEWKIWENLSEEEKQKVNLGIPSNKYLMLDKDLKGKSEEEIKNEWMAIKQKLIESGITSYVTDRSPQGFHVFIPFKDLDAFDEKLAKEVRKIYIEKFDCDQAKASMQGVISLPRRPHFKTGKTYDVIEITTGINELNQEIITEAKINLERNANAPLPVMPDKDFKDYFTKDPFFNYIANNIIPDSQERNNVIFPNLAIACAKSGKTKEEIDAIIKPVIKKNFPGKIYAEFEGWLRKAMNNQIDTYNQIQINTWSKNYTPQHREFYDLTPISVEDQLLKESDVKIDTERNIFISHGELMERIVHPTKWLVENWIAKGDICFIAGKSASFKTTLVNHMVTAIAEDKLVFNKYAVDKCKVLYLNEEMQENTFKELVIRVTNGLDLPGLKSDNVFYSIIENLKIDNNKVDDVKKIIDFVNAQKIEVIVFDSYRRFFTGQEDKADVANTIFNILKIIRKRCNNPTIILIHHAKKDSAESQNMDIRDTFLRGSSDILNFADSAIGVRRKMKQNKLIIEHIKNRSGQEIQGKIIQLDNEENKVYIWETADAEEAGAKPSKPEECAEAICNFLDAKNLVNFTRRDIDELTIKFSYDTMTKALRTLKQEGMILEAGAGKRLSYTYNAPVKEKETEENPAVKKRVQSELK